MVKMLSLFILLISLVSCSQKPEEVTETKIFLGASADLFPGGGFIIGHNEKTRAAFVRQLYGDSISLDLDNGEWEFAAFGWNGIENMEGSVSCTLPVKKTLNGEEVDIELHIEENGVCSDSVFGKLEDKTPEKRIKPVAFYSCVGLAGVPDADINASFDCSGSEGSAQSFSITLYDTEFFKDSGLGNVHNKFESKCIVRDQSFHYTLAEVEMPILDGIPFSVTAYSDEGCNNILSVTTLNANPAPLLSIKKFGHTDENHIFIDDTSTVADTTGPDAATTLGWIETSPIN